MENKSSIRKISSAIKSLFVSGLLTIFPAALTVFVISFSYHSIAKLLAPLKKIEPTILTKFPGSEIVLIILLLIIIGILMKFLIINPIIHHAEKIITKIPIIKSIYSSAKTLVNFFQAPTADKQGRKVVLIRYPNDKFYAMAFLVGQATYAEALIPEKQKIPGETYLKVYLPTSHPYLGTFLIVPKSEVIITDISFEESLKTIISCGLISPEMPPQK